LHKIYKKDSNGGITMEDKVTQQVKEALLKLQDFYLKKDLSKLDSFINDRFISSEDLSLIGTGFKDWYFGQDGVKEAIRTHLENEEEYLNNIEFDMDSCVITTKGNAVMVAAIGRSRQYLPKYKLQERLKEDIKIRLAEEVPSKEELMKISIDISRILFDIYKGEKYIWPFRFTAMLINENDKWLFKHIKFSFGSGNFWETRFTTEDFDRSLVSIPIKNNLCEETKEIIKVLEKYQEGYRNRDLSVLDSYSEEVFSNDDQSLVFGTDGGEYFRGRNAAKEITGLDWQWWGDFDLNINEAYISVYEDMAWVSSKAILRKDHSVERVYKSLKQLYVDYLPTTNITAEEILLKMLWRTTRRLYEGELGDVYIAPMRFVGVMIKDNGKWRFQHLHFSDNVDGMPEERVYEDS
jgi:hypothetical protein